MGVTLYWKDKTILDCANRLYGVLYCQIIRNVENRRLKFNHDLRELLEDLERGCDGWHIEIADYIYTKEDFLIFLTLVEEAIIKIFSIENSLGPYKHFFDNFLKELKIAYQNFEPDPLLPRSANGTFTNHGILL